MVAPKKGGATGTLLTHMARRFSEQHHVQTICLGSKHIEYCTGCKSCYQQGACWIHDDVTGIMAAMDAADVILMASPSYWADITGQMKVFIDRSLPYCNTHPGYVRLQPGKKGFAVALRTGGSPGECQHIIGSVRHYCGHMEIEFVDGFYLCGIDRESDVNLRAGEIDAVCDRWLALL